MDKNNSVNQRQQQILDYLAVKKYATIINLSNVIKVSQATIRRDVSHLEKKGDVIQVHGGVLNNNPDQPNPFSLKRLAEQSAEKFEIGKLAASLVSDGESIFIQGGSTTEYMIAFLAEKKNITVITNALNIAYKVAFYPQMKVIIVGGQMDPEFNLMGHITEKSLEEVVAQKVFRSVTGIDLKYGLTSNAPLDAIIDRLIASRFEKLIVLADYTKFSQTGSVHVSSLSDVDTIVTDRKTPRSIISKFRSSDINIIQPQ